MARKATTKSAGGSRSKAAPKPKKTAAAPRKAKAKPATKPKRSAPKSRKQAQGKGAADALIGLIESPLVADLLAAAVTAATATILEHKLKKQRSEGSLVRAVGAAAAAAVGKQLAAELKEIREAARDEKGGK